MHLSHVNGVQEMMMMRRGRHLPVNIKNVVCIAGKHSVELREVTFSTFGKLTIGNISTETVSMLMLYSKACVL